MIGVKGNRNAAFTVVDGESTSKKKFIRFNDMKALSEIQLVLYETFLSDI